MHLEYYNEREVDLAETATSETSLTLVKIQQSFTWGDSEGTLPSKLLWESRKEAEQRPFY